MWLIQGKLKSNIYLFFFQIVSYVERLCVTLPLIVFKDTEVTVMTGLFNQLTSQKSRNSFFFFFLQWKAAKVIYSRPDALTLRSPLNTSSSESVDDYIRNTGFTGSVWKGRGMQHVTDRQQPRSAHISCSIGQPSDVVSFWAETFSINGHTTLTQI